MKLSILPLVLAPIAMVQGDYASKFVLLSPSGYCVDSKGLNYYSYVRAYFPMSTYPTPSQRLEVCSKYCLQNGPPKNMIGFETYTMKDSSDKEFKCECTFDGNLPNPLPTYSPVPNDTYNGTSTGPLHSNANPNTLCYALKSNGGGGGSKSSKNSKSSSPHAKSAKVGKRG